MHTCQHQAVQNREIFWSTGKPPLTNISFSSQSSSDLSGRLWGIPLVSDTKTLAVDPLGPACWGVGASWIRLVLAHPTDAQLDQDLGRSVPFLSRFCCVSGRTVLLGRLLPSGSAVVKRRCTWFTTVFGLVMCVKCHPHLCQDLRLPSRKLHCNEMTNAIHISWQCF